jgi:hypothetical protein
LSGTTPLEELQICLRGCKSAGCPTLVLRSWQGQGGDFDLLFGSGRLFPPSRKERKGGATALKLTTASKPHDVISTVDVDDFAGNAARSIGSEKNSRAADFGDFDVAS